MKPETLEVIRTFTPYVLSGITLGWLIVVFVLKKTYAKQEDVDAQQAELADLRSSYKRLDEIVRSLPSHDEISDLKLSIERLRGDIKEIRPKLEGLDRISGLLLENEIKGKH
ncbi:MULTISPECIES: DUF2730 family protein [Vibrio]|uniref:DUF2730 domain-containing protein n=1 Tax=Vibrio mimicus TaxID=674 RepID=A0A2J9VKJ4_VIBMI|nr:MULTISPECIES: DUF2730 family protein [Vibrio]EEW12349.1 hypothetical protein VMD_03660 [Vibrio mimicus VM573]EGR0523757.1 DUF2730 family protein [Vibrio cholerae]EGR0598467.1 DUF2730 family protein [Vibrio cholerae]EGR1044250.1 DUF2730 family protein [Vibrio cholerae]EGR2081492.1 DUF2730 family protein [Vibrio cholerae]